MFQIVSLDPEEYLLCFFPNSFSYSGWKCRGEDSQIFIGFAFLNGHPKKGLQMSKSHVVGIIRLLFANFPERLQYLFDVLGMTLRVQTILHKLITVEVPTFFFRSSQEFPMAFLAS